MLIDSMSSGLRSATASEPGWSLMLLSPVPPVVVLNIGIPSITYRALLFFEIDFTPRMMTFAAPPAPTDDELIVTPATLPLSEFMKFASLTLVISSDLICCTL